MEVRNCSYVCVLQKFIAFFQLHINLLLLSALRSCISTNCLGNVAVLLNMHLVEQYSFTAARKKPRQKINANEWMIGFRNSCFVHRFIYLMQSAFLFCCTGYISHIAFVFDFRPEATKSSWRLPGFYQLWSCWRWRHIRLNHKVTGNLFSHVSNMF